MSEKLDRILDGLTAETVKVGPLVDEQHPIHVVRGLRSLAAWAQLPGDGLGLAVDRGLLNTLLSYGQEGILRIYNSFTEETARTADEAAAIFAALQTVTRQARSMRLIGWALDGVRPETPRGPRLLVELDSSIDTALRAAAAARGETLKAFTTEAIKTRLDSIERGSRAKKTASA